MKIGIIGPSKVNDKEKITEVAKIIANSGHEIIIVPHKKSSSEFFGQEYIKYGGKKVYSIVPLEDTEYGFDYLNLNIGEQINCGIWRESARRLNKETDALLCLGYASGVLIEIGYTKWIKPKPVYIIKELVSVKLPKEFDNRLDLRYVSIKGIGKKLN